MKICAILDNFGAGEGFSMKTDNTDGPDANKIPQNLIFSLQTQYMKVYFHVITIFLAPHCDFL